MEKFRTAPHDNHPLQLISDESARLVLTARGISNEPAETGGFNKRGGTNQNSLGGEHQKPDMLYVEGGASTERYHYKIL